MSNHFKRKLYLVLLVMIILSLTCICLYLYHQGLIIPYMKLNDEKTIYLEIHDKYEEPGIKIMHNFQDRSHLCRIQSNLNHKKLGTYEILYEYEDKKIIRNIHVVDTQPPNIKLEGEKEMILFENEEYIEPGWMVRDNSLEDLSSEVKVDHLIDTSQPGSYVIDYKVEDSSGNKAITQRLIEVVQDPMLEKLFYHYDHIDNTSLNWWFHKAKDHLRKAPSFDLNKMKQYHAYHLGVDDKVIYLTFDEGGNDITYIKEITDILNRHDIQATFFLTRNYIKNEKSFMKELIEEGHEIGNHTRNHYKMSDYANIEGIDVFTKEILETEKTIYEVTKQKPEKIFRFPSGEYSERALSIVSDLGYKTYFWSHAYMDYGKDVSEKEAYNNLVSHLHPGAIYLLHPSNKGNYEAMDSFIEECLRQGYRFDIVSNIE